MGNFQKYWSQNVDQDFIVLLFFVGGRKRCVREINVSRAWDPVHAGDKALTRETPAKRGRVNRYAKNNRTSDGYALDKSLGGFILFRNLIKSSFNVLFCFAYFVQGTSNLLLVWPIYTISALVIRMLKTTKVAHQEGYLKSDVFDGKTMDINYRFIYD